MVGESRKFEIQVDVPYNVQLNNFPCYIFNLSNILNLMNKLSKTLPYLRNCLLISSFKLVEVGVYGS